MSELTELSYQRGTRASEVPGFARNPSYSRLVIAVQRRRFSRSKKSEPRTRARTRLISNPSRNHTSKDIENACAMGQASAQTCLSALRANYFFFGFSGCSGKCSKA